MAVAAMYHTVRPEVVIDLDGAVEFDLRLKDGRLILAELSGDGSFNGCVFSADNKHMMQLMVIQDMPRSYIIGLRRLRRCYRSTRGLGIGPVLHL